MESNKGSYDCFESTNMDLNQKSIKSTKNDGLESENLQIDKDVTLNLSLSNLEISSTAIQRLTPNTLII